MANFKALNIESDDDSDDEIDNTKELQIEEALKLYQNALKLHSQGPVAYVHAAEAYKALFRSEIFKYQESITEFARIEENPELELVDPSFSLDLDLGGSGTDGSPSTLPQILYLAHKNHGQFILDCVKHRVRTIPIPPLSKQQLDYQGQAALDNFALALVRDESDTQLWRQTARIGSMLGSKRIARYCLEAGVEVDDDPTVAEVEPPSLEEGFAGEQLKVQLENLSDEVALSHPIMGPFKKKKMANFLTKHMDPYPFLPASTGDSSEALTTGEEIDTADPRLVIDVNQCSWSALGEVLLTLTCSQDVSSGVGLSLKFPTDREQNSDASVQETTAEDQIMKDVEATTSPIVEGAEPAPPTSAQPEEPVVQVVTTTTTVPLAEERARSSSIAPPTRKRSQSAAGLKDTPGDDGNLQKRSKRIQNRDNTSEVDPAVDFAEQLKKFVRADEDMFSYVDNTLKKIGVDDLGTFQELQTVLSDESEPQNSTSNIALRDLRDTLRSWDDNKGSAFVNANAADILGSAPSGANAGLAAFLEHSKVGPLKLSAKLPFPDQEGLVEFAERLDTEWMPLQDVVFEWISHVLATYEHYLWSEALKRTLVQLLMFVDSDVYERVQTEIPRLRSQGESQEQLQKLETLVQVLFELHLDIYSRITNPNSIISFEIRIATKERLDRWADFATDVIQSHEIDFTNDLVLRYLWTSVFYATMGDDVSREHKVLCWSDLQAVLFNSGKPTIELQNNAVMAEISTAAAEREVSRLSTMDFFYNLFQTDTSNPTAIIETLEPVLDPESTYEAVDVEGESAAPALETADSTPAALRDMWKFLKSGSTSLRLFLWQRLREAYLSIGYPTKVFSCFLKSIEIIVEAFRSPEYVDLADEPRRYQLLMWLKALDDLLVSSLTKALNDTATCFDIIDDRHLKSTCAALAQLNRILHAAAIFDDEVKVGSKPLPTTHAYSQNGTFNVFTAKLREMQIRTWALQYTMVKEATTQNVALFPSANHELADFLALVHYALGLRKFCRASNKIFLKMMKVEILRFKFVERWEDYLGQVLFDLYGIRLGVGTYLLEDHGCPTEPLDKRTVLGIVEQVILLASRMPMKDLMKHELRTTLEKMQTAIGPAKPTTQMHHNLRNVTEYLRMSIRPLRLYQALKGQFQIDSLPVLGQDGGLAEKGWYFLQGMLALTKFRSQKRTAPGGQTDDLRVAAVFLRLDLQYSADRWETWYRLAQCFDCELEDEVLWSADKINNGRADLTRLQRSSIHCYVMALSTATRLADDNLETASKLSEMYHDFGMRIYASSREPFEMEAFWVDDFERHMSAPGGLYTVALHSELSRYKAWEYAAALFKRALLERPSYWLNHFMLGKCLWKMFSRPPPEGREPTRTPTVDDVLKTFVKAIKTAPKPKDRGEPLLEPHYKLVSIVYKLVLRAALQPQDGADLLQEQPLAVRKGERVEVTNPDNWEAFLLEYIRGLRKEDKQHWHHRMVARAAKILYKEFIPVVSEAAAALHEFRESIYTKTMHIQVWKPEVERPGRHCVYMERYVLFTFKLLWTLNDKANMEMLVKRVRKKSSDFYRFSHVWVECCNTYLRMIRRASAVLASMEDVFKGVAHDEFEIYSDRLQLWMSDPNSTHPALDALRESVELKKLNATGSAQMKIVPMKSAPIDDMINDAWATLYVHVAPTLPGPPPATMLQSPTNTSSNIDGSPRSAGPMSLNNMLMNTDGTSDSPSTSALAGASPSDHPRAKKVGIARRDVLRRAEIAVARAADAPRAAGTTTTVPSQRQSSDAHHPTSILGSNAPPLTFSGATNSGKRNGNAGEERRGAREDSSAPGSLHDSADDESDLSDVPDMEEAEILFPNLVAQK